MDPAIISALSGAPASIVALYLVVRLLQDQRGARKDFLEAIAAERSATVAAMQAERGAMEAIAGALNRVQRALDRQSGVIMGSLLGSLTRERAEEARRAADELFHQEE